MEPVFTPTETERSAIFDAVGEDEGLTPPTPALDGKQSEQHASGSIQEGSLPNSQGPATLESVSVSDELQFLRRRIDELEKQATGGPRDSHSKQPTAPDIDQKLSPAQIEYQRMLACLYGHRKEFETTSGPGRWALNRYLRRPHHHGPWKYSYRLNQENSYERPDPFDPTHDCNNAPPSPSALDDFDFAIDFGDRRESLRKHFEWELDRLYLAEEMHRRQARRREEEAFRKTQAQESNAVDTGQTKGASSDRIEESGTQAAQENEPGPTVVEPKLTRSQWHAFKRFGIAEQVKCQIDVLVGEPIVQDDLVAGYARWYGYSGHLQQKISKVEPPTTLAVTAAGESPLPERVRIYSQILINILAKIVGSDSGSLSELQIVPVIFIRPFKLLTYCERALRDWCTALRNRYNSPPDGEETLVGQEATADPGEIVAAVPVLEPADDHHALERSTGDDTEEETEGKEEDENDMTKSPEALQHLECLLEVINTDIMSKKAHLGDSQCRKVFFSDLWHLFRPGMEVISSNGKQVYRVVHVSSARHRVVPAWERFHDSIKNIKNKSVKAPFSLTCVYIDFDGTSLGPVSTVFEFKRFDGQRDITSLDVYPLRFHPVKKADFDEQEWAQIEALSSADRSSLLRQRFVDRGKLFLQVAQVKHMYYAGPTLGIRDEVESQVVVDFETAFAVEDSKQQEWKPKLEVLLGNSATEEAESEDESKSCQATCCRQENIHDDMYIDEKQRTEYIDSLLPKGEHGDQQPSIAIIPRQLKDLRTGPDKSLAVTTDELLIMSYRVFGFVLRTRKWAQLDLSYLSEVHRQKSDSATTNKADLTANNEADEPTTFDRLVIKDKHKDMIRALISQHFRDKKSTSGQREQVDIVRGKGKGLILLLHGAPGVGKTSTAEGVAELFQKPLFQITCGDLGTTAAQVEKALETTFALANRWDCILLLDEADVFLAQRSKEDFQRNGLVAVFLRVMEYYAGILFLTTNRVGDFDEAFTSRIHVSLYYPDLSSDQTVKIFRLNLEMIEERFRRKGRQIKIDDIDIILFADKYFTDHPHGRWNGRQIRNACQTALALAEYEAQARHGNGPRNDGKTDAQVHLTVTQFEVVSDAYLEFINYINRLFGTNTSRRAHEEGLRAFLAEANESIVANLLDKKSLFARSVQPQQPTHPQSQYPPPPPAAAPLNPYYGYNQPAAAPSNYLNPNTVPSQRQAYGNAEPWNSMPQPGPRTVHTPEPTYIPSQHSTQSQMQVPRTNQYPNQPMPPSYAEPEPQYGGQELPGRISAASNNKAPPQAWQREAGAQ